MKYNEICFIIIIIIIVIVIIYIVKNNFLKNEKFDNSIYWNNNNCKSDLNSILEEELKKANITYDDNKWTLYFPCSYNSIKDELENIPIKEGGKYFIIDEVDQMAGKDYLWENLVKYYGVNKAEKLVPKSYILGIDNDLKEFEKNYDPKKIYILKKNIQKQEGLKITNNKNEILNAKKDNYKLVQELLQNPYLVNGRKINLRCYVLVVCTDSGMTVYNYNDGFIYYTPNLFKKNSLVADDNITTGYIDRKVYDENPLTHQDLIKFMNSKYKNNYESKVCFDRINNLLREVFVSFKDVIYKNNKFKYKNITMFQLFGVDVAIDDKLYPKIMEINKGPDLNAKDERDKKLKSSVVNNILKIIGVVNNNNKNNFVKII